MELSTTAGWASMGFMPQEKIQLTRVAETAEAVANAKRLLDLGADGIKLYVASGGRNGASMSEGLIQSVVKEAHGRGKLVFVHPTTTDGLMASVRAGVDVLAHTTPQSGPPTYAWATLRAWTSTPAAPASCARRATSTAVSCSPSGPLRIFSVTGTDTARTTGLFA